MTVSKLFEIRVVIGILLVCHFSRGFGETEETNYISCLGRGTNLDDFVWMWMSDRVFYSKHENRKGQHFKTPQTRPWRVVSWDQQSLAPWTLSERVENFDRFSTQFWHTRVDKDRQFLKETVKERSETSDKNTAEGRQLWLSSIEVAENLEGMLKRGARKTDIFVKNALRPLRASSSGVETRQVPTSSAHCCHWSLAPRGPPVGQEGSWSHQCLTQPEFVFFKLLALFGTLALPTAINANKVGNHFISVNREF